VLDTIVALNRWVQPSGLPPHATAKALFGSGNVAGGQLKAANDKGVRMVADYRRRDAQPLQRNRKTKQFGQSRYVRSASIPGVDRKGQDGRSILAFASTLPHAYAAALVRVLELPTMESM
jgi:hypothetical protein